MNPNQRRMNEMGVTFTCIEKVEHSSTQDNIAYTAIHRFRHYLIELVFGGAVAEEFEEKSRIEITRCIPALSDWIASDLRDLVRTMPTPEAHGVFAFVNCSDCNAVFYADDIPDIYTALCLLLASDIVKDEWDRKRLGQMKDVFEDAKMRLEDTEIIVEMY